MSLPNVDADKMAAQTIQYMNVLKEHGAAIRGHPDCANAYQRVQDEGKVLPSGTQWTSLDSEGQQTLRDRMEDIIHSPATSIDDHVRIISAAHTLLLLQQDILGRLPYSESREVDRKINELRAERRSSMSVKHKEQFRPLIPKPSLPTYRAPASEELKLRRMTEHELDSLLDPGQSSIIGKQFRLDPDSGDFFYRVHSIKLSLDHHEYSVQYEDTSGFDIVDPDTMRSMLQDSEIVDSE